MKNYLSYKCNYHLPKQNSYNWVSKEIIKPPIFCSVDLRDGNQALVNTMNLEEKIEYFKLLVALGFKEIEIGFPAASDTEFEFARHLIENKLIPDDVTIQVFTQARDHIIKRTVDSVAGAKNAIIHMYNSTSPAQRQQVFKKSDDEIIKMAVEGAKLVKKYAEEINPNFTYQYCVESFSGTEMEFAVKICNAILEIWKPTSTKKVGINLPATVAVSMSHVYASQIEFMSNNLNHRENIILAVHPHNDRGTAVADTELALLAGADKVEGTLFGNGERTGNVDFILLAKNLKEQNVEINHNFNSLDDIIDIHERLTKMKVNRKLYHKLFNN